MRQLVVGLALGLGAGVVLGIALAPMFTHVLPQAEPSAASRESTESDEIRTLRGALVIERELRRQLAAQIEGRAAEPTPEAADELAERRMPAVDVVEESAEGADHPAAVPEEPWFGRDRLLSLGMYASEVERIHERWEQFTLDKLRIEDEAMRSGEGGQALFFKLLGLEIAVREDLGEEGYDAMLFASGAPNRVVIQDLLEISPGGEAGLQAGDRVIRYDGHRIFQPLGLRHATAQGTLGETVWMEVLRDGRLVTLRVLRGPLGARISAASETPLPR